MNVDYDELISVENLLRSWRTYKKGKSQKVDVVEFERHLEDSLFDLHRRLREESYVHGEYLYFRITDPKKRNIYKSTVRDRIVHQTLYAYLCTIYEPLFIKHSFSSRKRKGAHKAVAALSMMAKKFVKKRKECLAMKCDIRKYFENINHKILSEILENKIKDEKILNLLKITIESFHKETGRGIPLGNITSQIFANIYLNELDGFVSDELEIKDYIRYNDDFIVMGNDKEELLVDIGKIMMFLKDRLSLELPKEKTIFRKLKWGIDFCGYVILPNAVLLRNKTKGKMFEKVETVSKKLKLGKVSSREWQKTLDSYFGILSHCKSYNLRMKIKSKFLHNIFHR